MKIINLWHSIKNTRNLKQNIDKNPGLDKININNSIMYVSSLKIYIIHILICVSDMIANKVRYLRILKAKQNRLK